jgi:hypothetical protein
MERLRPDVVAIGPYFISNRAGRAAGLSIELRPEI